MKIKIALLTGLFSGACILSSWPLSAQGQASAVKQETFSSADEAIKALRADVGAGDTNGLAALFGPRYSELLTGNAAEDAANLRRFSRSLSKKLALSSQGSDEFLLAVGTKGWPFPIPLVKKDGLWLFDTAAGIEEVANRRIGKDELDAIGLCRAYSKGFAASADILGKTIHGYLFKTAAEQGASVSGNSVVLIAYPEQWGVSGIITFAVGRNGIVYKRNLGDKTAQAVAGMTQFDPGQWKIEREQGTRVAAKPAPAQ